MILVFLIMCILSGLFGSLGAVGTLKAFGRGIITFLPAPNFLIPLRCAQAVVSMPVMIPLGELGGISRQTTVLAFQMGY